MALESACIPVPSELVMPFSGYLASTGRFNLVLVVTAGAFGCSLGSTISYFVGATGGRRVVERWGRYIHLNKTDLDRFEAYFRRFGGMTIFVARLMPMVPAVISLPAGVARMPFWVFQICTFAGSWIWCFILALAGFKFGQLWASNPLLKSAMHVLDLAVVAIVIVASLIFVWRIWRRASNDD